jgi:type 1 fimbria pilin
MSTVNLGPIETTTVNAMGSGARTSVVLGASPCSLVNQCATRVAVTVSAGTVSALDLSLDGATFDAAGLLGGQVILNPGGTLRITYAVAPTVVFWPM